MLLLLLRRWLWRLNRLLLRLLLLPIVARHLTGCLLALLHESGKLRSILHVETLQQGLLQTLCLDVLLLYSLAFFGAEVRGELAFDVGNALMQETEEVERVLRVARTRSGIRSAGRRSLLTRLSWLRRHHLLLLRRVLLLLQPRDLLWTCHLLRVNLRWTLQWDLRRGLRLVGLLRLLLWLLLRLVSRHGRLQEALSTHSRCRLITARANLLKSCHHLRLRLHLGCPLHGVGKVLTVRQTHVHVGLTRLQRTSASVVVGSSLLLCLRGLLP